MHLTVAGSLGEVVRVPVGEALMAADGLYAELYGIQARAYR
jgi:hypothetical protein